MLRCSICFLALATLALAEPTTWQFDWLSASFAPENGRLVVTVGDRSFEPLAGAGPIRLMGEEQKLPKQQNIRLLGSERDGATLRSQYESDGVPFGLELTVAGEGEWTEFRFRWSSPERVWAGVLPGVAVGLGQQQPFFFNRVSESYGQASGGCTFRCGDADLWLFADWDVPSSNLTGYQRPRILKPTEINTNFPVDLTPEAMAGGNLPFAVAGTSVYAPDTAGRRLPLDDTLVLRIGKRLWEAVPTPSQPPSPYREELARSVFVDIWGGHQAPELTYTLNLMGRVTRGQVRFHTILQNWQCGGFDTLQPLSLRMPDYPPNPHIGTIAELRELCETGKRLGRFGFRTNYVYCKDRSPVVTSGEVRRAVNPDGSPRQFVRFSDVVSLAQRQEAEIAALFSPNCTFSDQLGSAGDCSLYLDHDATVGSPSLRQTWARIKSVCELLRQAQGGPLSSETLCGDFLLGGWIDAGDYGMFGGHERALAPDYKLRKLQHLMGFHGMALGYRFFFAPPYSGNDHHQRGEEMYRQPGLPADDYRACEVLYGNGAYLYLLGDFPWQRILTELIVVGRLQQRYALVPVESIAYYQPDSGQWLSLEDLAKAGVNVTPVRWVPQTTALRIARVRYANGLEVTVNRSPDPIAAECGPFHLRLPEAGWCAAMPDHSLVAFSAYWPSTEQRVDYLNDRNVDWRFLDPRGTTIDGISLPTLAVGGKPVVELLPGDQLRIDGETVPGHLPEPPPPTTIDFDFTQGFAGWYAARDILRFRQGPEGISLTTCGRDPYMVSSDLEIAPDQVKVLVVALRSNEPGKAAFFWRTEDANSFRGGALREFAIEASDDFREYRVPVGEHGNWRGKTITGLRLDPLSHDGTFTVDIRSIRGE